MFTPSYLSRLFTYLRRLLMDTQEEITQADSFRASEPAAEITELTDEVTSPPLTHEEFLVDSAAAYRLAQLEKVPEA